MREDTSLVKQIFDQYFLDAHEDLIQEFRIKISILKAKFTLEHHLTDREHFNMFLSILKYQKRREYKYKEKLYDLNHYYRTLLTQSKLLPKKKKSIHNKLKIIGILYRSFLSFSSVHKHQKKELDVVYNEFKKKKKSSFYLDLKHKLKQDLHAFILAEETHLILSMIIFEQKEDEAILYSKHIKQLNKLANLERKVILTALFFNLLPIHGLGDLLSTPFWLAEGGIRMYEHHFKEYAKWRKCQKITLQDLDRELMALMS